MPTDAAPPTPAPPAGNPPPGFAPLATAPIPSGAPGRTHLLRWLLRLRTVLWVSALIAIAVYFVGGMRPGVRLTVFVVYGLVALAYVGLHAYALATRRPLG